MSKKNISSARKRIYILHAWCVKQSVTRSQGYCDCKQMQAACDSPPASDTHPIRIHERSSSMYFFSSFIRVRRLLAVLCSPEVSWTCVTHICNSEVVTLHQKERKLKLNNTFPFAITKNVTRWFLDISFQPSHCPVAYSPFMIFVSPSWISAYWAHRREPDSLDQPGGLNLGCSILSS